MLGAGHYGTSSESVVALTVVLADGSILRTGARGPDGDTPFYRHYGPDLTGLFCGDSGVFGVKAEIVLRLIKNPPAHEGYASFSFATGRKTCSRRWRRWRGRAWPARPAPSIPASPGCG